MGLGGTNAMGLELVKPVEERAGVFFFFGGRGGGN